MALSVKLPPELVNTTLSDVEHFLIESAPNGIHLEGSSFYFGALPMLIFHYFECWCLMDFLIFFDYFCLLIDFSNELPVKLVLPQRLMSCRSRRELVSLSLLGQGTELNLLPTS